MITVAVAIFVISVVLLVRSGVIEYRFFQAIKLYEPLMWEEIARPNILAQCWALANFEKPVRIESISNPVVINLFYENRKAQIQFVGAFAIFLAVLIVTFRVA